MTSASRRFVVPALTTLTMLTVLVLLGTWQVRRLHWKQGILEQIATAEAASATPLTQHPAPYTKVSATGRFRFDLTAGFGVDVRDTKAGPIPGFQQIVPLEREGKSAILVDRGWVPEKPSVALDQPDGEVTVTGYVRPGERSSWFSATDDVTARHFYTLDPQVIAASLGIADPAPFTIVILGPATEGAYPAPANHLPQPPNNHLAYAITWYGLAAALIIVFGTWARKVLRS